LENEAMATHTNTTAATATIWPDLFGRIADIPAPAPRSDADLLTLCADFRRHHATLAATPYEDELATNAAFTTRQHAADSLAILRPTTEAGRRAKAAVGVIIMNEAAAWQRDSEWQFAAAAFRAEARA
jgi:hypothetical protein